jgi:hypothetical protein
MTPFSHGPFPADPRTAAVPLEKDGQGPLRADVRIVVANQYLFGKPFPARPSTETKMNDSDCAYALFVSSLPTDSTLPAGHARAVAARSIRRFGDARGCLAAVAYAYGDHPAEAAHRMRWALTVARSAHRQPCGAARRRLPAARPRRGGRRTHQLTAPERTNSR